MIRCHTGTPRSGKTLAAIKALFEDKQYKKRQVYYYGLQNCNVDEWHQLTRDQFEDWYNYMPNNAVLFVDECQEQWPPGASSKELPAHMTMLERHGHKGFDVMLTCHGGAQLHQRVKLLIDNHIHFTRPHAGDKYVSYQYSVFKTSPITDANIAIALKDSGKFDKKYFDKYISATHHTYKDRFPKKYKRMLWGMAIGLPLILFFVGNHFKNRLSPDRETVETQSTKSSQTSKSSSGIAAQTSINKSARSTEDLTPEYLTWLHTPLIKNKPDTAPIYNALYEAKDYPREQCILMTSGDRVGQCRCYTQQHTLMRDVDAQTCRHIIFEGREFDHRIPPTDFEQIKGDAAQYEQRSPADIASNRRVRQMLKDKVKIKPVRYPKTVDHPRYRFVNN